MNILRVLVQNKVILAITATTTNASVRFDGRLNGTAVFPVNLEVTIGCFVGNAEG